MQTNVLVLQRLSVLALQVLLLLLLLLEVMVSEVSVAGGEYTAARSLD